MDCIDHLWSLLGIKMAGEIDLQEAENETCYCCGRNSSSWDSPFFHYRRDPYINCDVPICAGCMTFFHGSFACLGYEKGTPDNPKTPGKLGMLTGCSLIASQTKALLLANSGWYTRLSAADHPICEIRNIQGKAAVEFALDYIGNQLPESEFPIIYIRDIGRKKQELITQLEWTVSRRSIYSCADTPAVRINYPTLTSLQDLAEKNKPAWNKFKRFISLSANGRIAPNDSDLNDFLADNPDVLAVARNLPADPHEKIQLLRCV